LNRALDVYISVVDVISRTLDLVLDLIEHFPLLLRQQSKVQEHLVQLGHASLQRKHVLVFISDVVVNIFDWIRHPLQNLVLVQLVPPSFRPHDAVDFLVCGLGLDNLNCD